jgi:hypothetical protein
MTCCSSGAKARAPNGPGGAAWLHEDGQGLNLALEFGPVNGDGRLVVRIRKDGLREKRPSAMAGEKPGNHRLIFPCKR